MKILLSGGGTLGSVTPLMAIQEIVEHKYSETEIIWVGTKTGPERQLLEKRGDKFVAISSGKLNRFFTIKNILQPLKFGLGFFQALVFILKEQPDLCISAGGYVSVPLHYAAWISGVPTWIHQQDVRVGLANKMMAPFSKIITTALKKSLNDFSETKTYWLGNPVRKEIMNGDKHRAQKAFKLEPDVPVVFATGGGTGSLKVNQMIVEAAQHLKDHCQIIHLSGLERPQEMVLRATEHLSHYQVYQFFTEEMKDAYAAADIIISRGGFGTLTEIAALKKAAIIIPKPGHQEENVKALAESGAIIYLDERTSDGLVLARKVRTLLSDKTKCRSMAERMSELLPRAQDKKILELVERFYKKDGLGEF